MHLLTGDEVGRSLQEGPQVLAVHVDRESFGAAPAIAYARLTDLEFSAFNRLPLAAQSPAPHAHRDRIPGRTHSCGFAINEFSRPVIVGNSIRLASKVESGDALG
jgi:hypothetical protein